MENHPKTKIRLLAVCKMVFNTITIIQEHNQQTHCINTTSEQNHFCQHISCYTIPIKAVQNVPTEAHHCNHDFIFMNISIFTTGVPSRRHTSQQTNISSAPRPVLQHQAQQQPNPSPLINPLVTITLACEQ